MESIRSSSTTSRNSDALADLRDSGAWARLRNAVSEPVRELIAVEIDTQARAREVIARLIALGTGPPQLRPHVVIEFCPVRDEPAELLARALAAAADWRSEQGLLFLLDTGEPPPAEDGPRPVAFWRGMNLLREQWDALDCQTLFLLLPSNYRLLSSAADHLKRWMPLKVHLLGGGSRFESDSPRAPVDIAEAGAARERLETLEAQLRQAIQRGEPSGTFVRRYYLPMFAAAVALGDYDRARHLRKKLERVEVAEADLGGWFNVSFNYELGQYRLAEAQAVAERHLRWAQERSLPLQQSIALVNLGSAALERRDFAAAESWYRKALAIEENQGNEHDAAITYHQLGLVAQERRDFAAAEAWYRKSLAIDEKQGNEDGAAISYHQLGRIAQERRDFAAAEAWYSKSLAIKEKQGDEHGATTTYHQLGRIAQERRDFAAAEAWYRKSLAIKEKQGHEHGAAMDYHQLGRVAQERGDFAAAEPWYRKSLAIEEKQGNEHGAAITYHQLGILAQERRDFAAAEAWYRKSLAIEEKQGNEHGAAISYHQLGRIGQEQRDFGGAGRLFLKALGLLASKNDPYHAEMAWKGFVRVLGSAPPEVQAELRALGRAAVGEEKMSMAEAALHAPS